jgi:hypothetical protein
MTRVYLTCYLHCMCAHCVACRLIPHMIITILLYSEVLHSTFIFQSQSYIATDDQSISKSWCRAPRYWLCGAPSLTRGRVCLLYMLLALASAVFLGSESLGSRVHILLSQFWDFPFRRLLRLAGSRWRYSTPPPHGSIYKALDCMHIRP